MIKHTALSTGNKKCEIREGKFAISTLHSLISKFMEQAIFFIHGTTTVFAEHCLSLNMQ